LALYDKDNQLLAYKAQLLPEGEHEIMAAIPDNARNYRAVLFAYDDNTGMANKVYSLGTECVIAHYVSGDKLVVGITNYKDIELNGKIIITSYSDSGKLSKAVIKDAAVKPHETLEMVYDYTVAARTDVFYWDGLDTMIQLAR